MYNPVAVIERQVGKDDDLSLRYKIIDVCKKLSYQGFVQGTSGNISARTKNNTIIITPSGWHKGDLEIHNLTEIDFSGKKLSGTSRPSTEYLMHIIAYQERPEIKSVVHAHPPYCTTWASVGKPIPTPNLPEVVVALGEIAFVDYATPSTLHLSRVLKPFLKEHTGFILCNHGAMTIGSNLEEAYLHMETLEFFARIAYQAKLLGSLNPLPYQEIERLKDLYK